MILCDFSQLVIASYMVFAYQDQYAEGVDENIVRHVALDGIRVINSKFKRQYGDLILAIDSNRGSWRKEIFPYYKANRAERRKKSAIDWTELFRIIDKIKVEIAQVFPYKVIEVDRAEADDIIATLTKEAINKNEEVMIVSSDMDFIQLQIGTNLVQQWDKKNERFVGAEDPKRYLFEHVLRGDSGDGIPNIISPSDSFVNKIRQKPMTRKRLDQFWDNPGDLRDNPRFLENLKIIDLNFIPTNIKQNIISTYEDYEIPDRNLIKNYMIENRMKKLYSNISDF